MPEAYQACPEGAGWAAVNPAQQLQASFTPAGVSIHPASTGTGTGTWTAGLTLTSPADTEVARYDGLVAYDATGTTLPAHVELTGTIPTATTVRLA